MPAADSTHRCPSDCLCQTHTYSDVVPYREKATEDTVNGGQVECPTDERLLHTWRQNNCVQCLTWWIERVWEDPRYVAIVRDLQRKFPEAEVDDLKQVVTAGMYKGRVQEWRNVAAYFRRALSYAASDQSRRRAREITNAEELENELLARGERESSNRLERLKECLKRLSEKERRLKEAAYDLGRSVVEIAKNHGESYDAVVKQLSRLRKKLGDCIRSKE